MNSINLKKIFGNSLKYYRFSSQISQETLAEKVGCSPICEIENGKYSVSFELIQVL